MLNKLFLLPKKPSSQKKLKKRILSTQNYFFPQKKLKTPSYYQKIYTITSDSLNKSNIENNKSPITTKKKIISLDNIFKKPKICQSTFQFRKITNPKLPFSSRKIEPKEVTKNRIKLSKPSTAFHDFTTIQWLRQKFSENMINKSIYSLLPNNGKPVIPENESEEGKRHRKMMEYLESMKEPLGRERYVNINPKYFFSKTTFENVLKLKRIFLEFDKDGNRRMELDEMLEMFMSNKISANINDLVELFFRGKKFKQKEVMKLYLNFHQFIYFALTKDQDFRQFIRNIKERSEKEKERKLREKKKLGVTTNNSNGKDNEIEKDGYLPMSFNSLLDYFVDKGKERASKEVINKAIEEMNKIINKTKDKFNLSNSVRKRRNDKEKKIEMFKTNNEMKKVKLVSQKTINSPTHTHTVRKHISHKNIKKVKINKNLEGDEEIERINFELSLDDNDYENQLKNINFNKIIEEFYTLFNIDRNFHHQIETNETKLKSSQRKEPEKKENKISHKENDINKKTIIKSYSQSLLNSFSTGSQDNFINNLKSSTKGDSNTIHKSLKDEMSTIKDYKLISDKNKLFSSTNYGMFNKTNTNKYKYIKLINNSRNKNNVIYKNLKNMDSENKSLNSITKSQIELPQIYEKNLKLKNNANNIFGFNHDSKTDKNALYKSSSYFKYPLSKSMKEKRNFEFNNNKMNKYFVNIYGGKINIFKNINDSSTKLDYVPMKLLTNLKHKLKNKNL